MVFKTVNIQKRKSPTKQKCCDYVFKFIIEEEYEAVFNILQNAMEIFNSDNIYNGEWRMLREEKEIFVWIKDFPNRKRQKFEKDLKRFFDRLLELTGEWYVFKLDRDFKIESNELGFVK